MKEQMVQDGCKTICVRVSNDQSTKKWRLNESDHTKGRESNGKKALFYVSFSFSLATQSGENLNDMAYGPLNQLQISRANARK